MAFGKFDHPSRDFNRQMIQGNWTCSDCGAEITQLPFQPAPGKEILCKECWLKKRRKSGFDRPFRNTPRQMIQGNWTCSDCGAEITQLPFQPAPDKEILCKECWLKKRQQS